ncbi:serine hydrolase domain-containing protein [Nocardiopsis kunsanensis]|uniref:FmtA-like protein n=1 Tax=Nocardiopsis kunsanensis TaxID=141693 RepID=A0A918XCQ5_9ACTN|nr:serine hydrolase domain-containing protein [Nocardiopsis kunsanensis]GHD25130.1 FmtA-like protein [Nocardiopsis kunsanensis]
MFPSRPTPRAQRPRHGRRPLAVLAAAGTVAVLATSCAGATGAGPAPPPSVPNPEAAGAELTEQDVNAWLDGVLPAYLDQAQIAGAGVSVVADGELLTARGYGYSDVEAQEPVDPEETLFRVASVTKTFTATAVMQMVEAGELDLDTDVDEYLDFEVDKSYDQDLTLRHLLSHTGGFEERVANAMLGEGKEVDLRSVVSEDPPEQVYEPGTTPAYSNYGIALAGYVVENTSGTPFTEYIEENVLAPAGMDSSTLEQPLPEELESRLSEGYVLDEEPAVERFETVSDSPAGGLTSSVTDMAEFMRVHMEASEGAGVLEPETIAQMHEPALGEESLGGLAGGAQMGLGFFQEERNGNRVVSHGGDTDVFHSEMQIYPEENAGIFITLNSSGNSSLISHSMRLALAEGFADRYFPGEQADGGQVEPTAGEHAALLEGNYTSSRSIHSNFASALYTVDETQIVATEDDTIVLTSPETGQPTEYIEVEPWVWREIDGHRTLAADVVDGEVRAIGTTAFTFIPVDENTQAAVVLPVAISSVAVIVVAILSWPVSAFVRWRTSLPKRDRTGLWARLLTRTAMILTLLGFVGWALALNVALSFEPVSFGELRSIQVVQGLGALGIFPAAYVLYDNIRRGEGWGRYIGSSLVLLALLGTGWIATVFGMVAGSVSF